MYVHTGTEARGPYVHTGTEARGPYVHTGTEARPTLYIQVLRLDPYCTYRH